MTIENNVLVRRILIGLNGLLVVAFCGLLGYTFFAREHLVGKARDYVTLKTVEYSGPIVAATEPLLDDPKVRLLLPKPIETMAREQFAAYHRNPTDYVAELTGKSRLNIPPRGNEPMIKVLAWKQAVVDYYDKVLRSLILDVRVFAVTNIVAACAACYFAARARANAQPQLIVVSCAIFIALVFCSWEYVDSITFFKIITNSFSLIAYPVTLMAMFLWIHHELSPALGDDQATTNPPSTSK